MPSTPREASSSSNSSTESPSNVIQSDQIMGWNEWQRWMSKLQSRGLNHFLNRYVATRRIDIEKFLANLDITISIIVNESLTDQPQDINRIQSLIKLERSIIKFLKVRKKLPEYNTIDDAVSLIQRSKKILILTGAGISTSCGIPDFRSENGLYSQLEDYDGLDDPYDMFDLKFFKSNPEPFYKFIKTIFPFSSTANLPPSSSESKTIIPSDSHRFIKLVESKSKLLRNYTQNIDTLEMRAGVQNFIQCHGSFAKFTCLKCQAKYPGSQFEDLIAQAKVILCPSCSASPTTNSAECQPSSKKRRKTNSGVGHQVNINDDDDDNQAEVDWVSLGLMKPDIIFFGEGLPSEFDEAIEADRSQCDLMIVIGTSLKVAPVSEIIKFIPDHVPQILINRDPIYRGKKTGDSVENSGTFEYDGDEFEFDIYLFGDSDLILREMSSRLGEGWELPVKSIANGSGDHHTTSHQDKNTDKVEQKIEFSQYHHNINHIWLFSGSNSCHPWFNQWQRQANQDADGDSNSSESEPETSQTKASSTNSFESNERKEEVPHCQENVEKHCKPEEFQKEAPLKITDLEHNEHPEAQADQK